MATLGYTESCTHFGLLDNQVMGMLVEALNPMTITSLHGRIKTTVATHKCKMALYTSAGALIDETPEQDITVASGTIWRTFTFDTAVSIGYPQDLVIVAWANDASGECRINEQTLSDYTRKYRFPYTYNSFPSSISWWTTENFVTSAYATYTAEAWDYDSEIKKFRDNLDSTTLAAAVETWLDSLSLSYVGQIQVNHVKGFYVYKVIYV